MTHFSNPQEFLDHVRVVESKVVPKTNIDQKFQQIQDEQMKEGGITLPLNTDSYDLIVGNVVKEIVGALPSGQQKRFEKSVAAGCLEHPSVNAQILRSPDDRYAIVLNKGLLILLNKFMKLIAAGREPEAVIYCNRGEPSQFDYLAYQEMADEILSQYAETGIPAGPRIKFDLDSEAAALASGHIHMTELFIFSHEIGHFFNGDLANHNCFTKWHVCEEIDIFRNEKCHQMEFAADRFAFEHVMRVISSTTPELPAFSAFSSAILSFNFLRGIANRESYSHPAPSVRLIALTKEFFGEDAANSMERSFLNPRILLEIQAASGKPSVTELLQRRDSMRPEMSNPTSSAPRRQSILQKAFTGELV